ncbi:hypothetical protein Tco_0932292 [Tanacetum coccineum]
MVRSMMSQTTLQILWDYALETASRRISHKVPTKKVEKTPYEVWHGQAPKLSYLKVWGCEAVLRRDTLPADKNKVLVARNAEFLENNLIDAKVNGSSKDLEIYSRRRYASLLYTLSLKHEEDD